MPDDRPALAPADLYEQDFYLWTQAQAEALRDHHHRSKEIEWDRVAEEIEELGSAQRNAVESHVRQIISRLYKLASSRNPDPRRHWRVEIAEHRAEAEGLLTRAIRRDIEESLERVHRKAAKPALEAMELHEPGVPVDTGRRWTLAQILGEEDDPLPPR